MPASRRLMALRHLTALADKLCFFLKNRHRFSYKFVGPNAMIHSIQNNNYQLNAFVALSDRD
jgi:hypothetical protein